MQCRAGHRLSGGGTKQTNVRGFEDKGYGIPRESDTRQGGKAWRGNVGPPATQKSSRCVESRPPSLAPPIPHPTISKNGEPRAKTARFGTTNPPTHIVLKSSAPSFPFTSPTRYAQKKSAAGRLRYSSLDLSFVSYYPTSLRPSSPKNNPAFTNLSSTPHK